MSSNPPPTPQVFPFPSSALLAGLFILAACLPTSARAEVKPNPLFADNAVLQQGMEVPVWGTARAGENVTVEFGSQHVSAVAAPDGKWSVRLRPLTASDQPASMTIRGDNTVTLKNLLVGEVWICSGQSNMERQLGPRPPQPEIDNWRQEAAGANFPTLREFHVPNLQSGAPVTEAAGQWTVCTPQTAPAFSAVGFFFARALQAQRHVPMGLLFTTWGGTQAEAWTSHDAILALPDFHKYVEAFDKALADYPAKAAEFQQNGPAMVQKWQDDLAANPQKFQPLPAKPDASADPATVAQWQADVTRVTRENRRLPQKPTMPNNPAKDNRMPSVLYNGMIAPLEPYAIRGVTWYQGESNSGHGKTYRALFPAMIADWRKQWGEGDFPFLYVQVAPYDGTPPDGKGATQPDIREAQLLTLKASPRTAMIVTTDIGDAHNIHPSHKAPVGERLALAARALAYDEKIEYSGPVFEAAKFEGNHAVLTFTHADSGLVAKDGPLKGFGVAGADQKFVPAEATISGKTVTVSNPGVPSPTAVRFGFVNSPEINLFNKEGLPASPFRTDVD